MCCQQRHCSSISGADNGMTPPRMRSGGRQPQPSRQTPARCREAPQPRSSQRISYWCVQRLRFSKTLLRRSEQRLIAGKAVWSNARSCLAQCRSGRASNRRSPATATARGRCNGSQSQQRSCDRSGTASASRWVECCIPTADAEGLPDCDIQLQYTINISAQHDHAYVRS